MAGAVSPDRFAELFTPEQAKVVAAALDDVRDDLRKEIKRIIVRLLGVLIVVLLVSTAWVYHRLDENTQQLAAASQSADRANRETARVNRIIADDARERSDEAARSARKTARSAYAACRLTAYEHVGNQLLVNTLLASPIYAVHVQALKYQDYLQAQHLLDIPVCPKPPKEEASQ